MKERSCGPSPVRAPTAQGTAQASARARAFVRPRVFASMRPRAGEGGAAGFLRMGRGKGHALICLWCG